MNRYEAIIQRICSEFPAFKIVERDKSWLRLPFRLLSKVTKTDYFNFVTTIGSTIYVGPGWNERSDNDRYRVLRHELIHIRQFHNWPFGRRLSWLNHAFFSFAYLFILPFLWTFRAKFEREAYTQTLLVQFELGGTITDPEIDRNTERMVRTFSGPAYLWMATKKSTYHWAMLTQRKINDLSIENKLDRISDIEAEKGVG